MMGITRIFTGIGASLPCRAAPPFGRLAQKKATPIGKEWLMIRTNTVLKIFIVVI